MRERATLTDRQLDVLRQHADPSLVAAILAEGQIAAPALALDLLRLRSDLRAVASYLPSPIVRAVLADPVPGRVSGAFWDGAVLFADLSGFTALSEQLSALGKQGAEEISAIINQLFSTLLAEIHRYGGSLLKFGGDALTAFFDAGTLGSSHAELAAQAALAMQARMAEAVELHTRAGRFTLRLRIGVHAGRVFAAQVGDLEHIELVVTGHTINRVAAAQEIAEPGEVVVTRETLALLPGAHATPRRDGFLTLTAAQADHTPQTTPTTLPPATSDLNELIWLAERIAALRPYLPYTLPRRFVTSAETAEDGEFRPVTIVFSNVADLSAILESMQGRDDAADLVAQMLNAYYKRAQAAIHHYGGIVNKVDMYTHGDKLMALFGAPVAHEDDPLRAVRAALAMRVALSEANQEVAALLGLPPDTAVLSQRIGINTGVVFAGKVGSRERHEYTVMGPNVNLAARLMSVAGDGAIVISPSTRRTVGHAVVLRELTPVRLKGIAEPVPLAEVLSIHESARAASGSLARARLVGRDAELAALVVLGRAALAGAGHVVAICGEAGSGKTRLLDELIQELIGTTDPEHRAAQLPSTCLVECQSYEQTTPFAATHVLLEQILGPLGERRDAERVLRRIGELAPALARFAPLVAEILGLVAPETPLIASLTAEQRHDRALDLIEAIVLGSARTQPLVLIIDDLQWADASSLDLLTRLAQVAIDAPLLILFCYRSDPPIAEPWVALAHATRIELDALGETGSAALLEALLGAQPPERLGLLMARAQGNPFFIEEMVRGLIEAGLLMRDGDAWVLAGALETASLPDSIEGMITARLDRLEEQSRTIIQMASVVGRRFAYVLIAALLSESGALGERLLRLADAALIEPDALERELAYLFKHTLTRDVAYESILYARRRALHLRVAQQIEAEHADQLDDQLALLARHYQLAEEWQSAFDYARGAARRAQRRYANREAVALLEDALSAADRLGDAVGSGGALIEVYERLGWAHTLLGDYDQALVRYERALELLSAQPTHAVNELLRLHHHIARVYEKRAEFDTAFGWVERALALPDAPGAHMAVRCVLLGAGLHQRQGRYPQALEWGERALRLGERDHNLRDQAEALMLLGGTYMNLGENSHALELSERCLALYEQVQDHPRLADAHNNLAVAYYEIGRFDDARRHYIAGATIKEAVGDIYGEALIANNLAEILRMQGDLDTALAQYTRALAIFERVGSAYGTGVICMNVGATQLLVGEIEAASRSLERAETLFARAGAEDFLPELERYQAELLLARGDGPAARARAEAALATAQRLDARAEEGMTRRVLARALAEVGELAAAWQEIQVSQRILEEAESVYEVARTYLVTADLAARLERRSDGQQALAATLPILTGIGARRDLDEAAELAARWGYTIESP